MGTSLAGCSAFSSEPDTSFTGSVHTGEPLIKGTNVNTENPYPTHYSAIITSREEASNRIRWDYIERDIPLLTSTVQDADYNSEVQMFFGLVLPKSKSLEIESSSTDDETVRYSFRIKENISGGARLAINTYIIRLRTETKPNVEFSVVFNDDNSN